MSSAYDPPSAHSSVADTIVQQLEDKNRRKNNILFFNIPESETSNSGVDPGFVSKLCKDVYNLDIQILKAFHLGKKLANKSRPLLVQLESEDIKARILAKSYLLKSTELYNSVYVSADMTTHTDAYTQSHTCIHKHTELITNRYRHTLYTITVHIVTVTN